MANNTTLIEGELGYHDGTKVMKSRLLYDVMIPMLGLFTITINLAVVISSGLILKKRKEPRSTYMLLGNIALADLMTGLQVVLGQVFPNETRSHVGCTAFIGAILTSTIASVYSVLLIAIERYLYILHGLKYKVWITPKRMWQLIIIIWIFSILLGFLPIMLWNNPSQDGKVCWFVLMAPPYLLLFTAILGCIPVLIVCILYSIILYNAIKRVIHLKNMDENQTDFSQKKLRTFRGKPSVKKTQSEGSVKTTRCFFKKLSKMSVTSDVQYSNTPSQWKAIKVVLFTTLSFVVTWVPYFIACIMYFSCDEKTTPVLCESLKYSIASPLSILGFVNSLLNPLIYAWWHNGFRNSVKKIYCMNRESCKINLFFKNIKNSKVTESDNEIDVTSRNVYTVSQNVF